MPRRNLVLNPTFGQSNFGWIATGTGATAVRNDSGTPQPPNYLYGAAAGGTINVRPTDLVPVTANTRHTFSMWTYHPQGGSVRLDIDWHDAAGTYLSSSSTTGSGAGWVRRWTSGVAPAGATQARPWCAMLSATAGTTWGIDGALLEEWPSATPGSYFDGSFDGFRWEGTAHASFSVENSPPVARAGADRSVAAGATVLLDGRSSSDPDGDALSYLWSVVDAGGSGLTSSDLVARTTSRPSFTAPSRSVPSNITLRLQVVDPGGLSDTDDVVVSVAAVVADLRSGTGWAGPLGLGAHETGGGKVGRGTGWAGARVGLSARASGAKTSTGSGAARHGAAASGTGSARRQSHGVARSGLSGRAAGVKRGIGTGWAPPIGVRTDGDGLKRGIGAGQADAIGLGGYAVPPPPVPQFTGRPLAEDPLPLAQSRYLVQNILTGRWLHTDLPLTGDTAKLTLSGPCEITGTISPEYADLATDGNGPLLRSWGHVVYLELDGEIRAAGLVTEDSYDDQTQSIVCQGVSAYPSVTNYQGNYRRYFADPVTVAAEMWGYVQSFPNGNLGVQVTRAGGIAPVLYGAKVNPIPGDKLLGLTYGERPATGDEQDPPTLPVAYKNTLTAVWNRLLAMGYRGKPNDKQEALYVRKADLERAYTDYMLTPGQPHGLTMANPPDATSSVTIEPFKVDWWDAKWCGELIADSVKALPADYVEQYGWNFPRTFVDQRVMFAYPRVGRRRDDLRFVQGENIVQPIKVSSDPDSYGTVVVGTGAGEGSSSLRETAEVVIPGRLRKTVLYRNTKMTDRSVLARLVRDRLGQVSTGGYSIGSIVVQASHGNAAFGSYSVGDDILVQGEVPHYGWIKVWCRVLSMTLARGSDLVEVALRRSDSFYYGREVEST